MKGFFIEVTNNLLEPKHRLAISESIWLFMWFLDKITSISDEGVGRVLGGKPIKYAEVNKELNISRSTYVRWLDRLEKYGYVNLKQTPYGLIVTVNKAKKRFGRSVKNDTPLSENDTSIGSVKNDTSNKTVTVIDNNSKTIDALFENFWNEYPNKVAKKKAYESYKKIKNIETIHLKILTALSAHRSSDQWQKDGGRFIPHPTTWLNQERWNDQLKADLVEEINIPWYAREKK